MSTRLRRRLCAAVLTLGGVVATGCSSAESSLEEVDVVDTGTTLELTAVRMTASDDTPRAALERVFELENHPENDRTWAAMTELAQAAIGGGGGQLEPDRKWHSVKAQRGPALIDVKWHGQLVHVYYSTGHADDELQALLERLRASGFTILQGAQARVVAPEATVPELVAAQDAELEGW